MKKLVLVVFALILMAGCTIYPEQRKYDKPYPMWASFSHWHFCEYGYKDGVDAEEYAKSVEEGWWGEPVIYKPEKFDVYRWGMRSQDDEKG